MEKPSRFENCTVHTLDNKSNVAASFVVEKNLIVAVGTIHDMRSEYPDAVTVDLEGGHVIPGIIDGHAHPLMAAQQSKMNSVEYPSSHDKLLDWIRSEAKIKSQDQWIYIHRIFPSRLDSFRFPTLEELDKASPNVPVFLNGAFGAVLNTAAIKKSTLEKNRDHKSVIKDENGELTGAILRSAQNLVPYKTTDTGSFETDDYIAMLGKYLSLGITGVCEVFRTPETVNKIKLLADNGLLPLRMSFNYSPDIGLSVEDAIKKMDLAPLKCGEGNHFFKAGPLKTYIDGGMLTATAYMNEPYGKPASLMFGGGSNVYRGVTNYTDSEILGKIIDSARKKGWNFTAHCTGDGSASLLLDAYEGIHAVKSISGERYQILHANFMSQDLLDKCAKMGIILDIQPVWLYRDAKAIEFWFGKKRSRDFHPWRSALKKGIRLCAGSDHMDGLDPDSSVNPYNPWLGIYSFCARKGDKGDVFGKDEALTREEALRAYTINNAYKSGEEKIKGSIEAGKLADFIVLRKNPFTCDLEELPAIRPHIVAVDGVIKRVS